ncbi:an EAL and a GGDEF domain [Vibrio sp. B1FLJ16]|uniref:bifunctional diguanylate cyclase/phosphodiesterase n=1 Tax=Vibrio sp. B1FLJ16 TaxID=2751178 RepID=UPI0015F653C2|nr:EAL domain-containing protein [Vibrio sp. B1FLJ16]CAD7819568.1 an EAL and a GGDEF domain [Vibrio sp. B1FLJ16]CAE6939445.1 an EAL and a GGDEF domain [Vibrio sp. B1FLJ16]
MSRSLKSAIITPFVIIFFITFVGMTAFQLYQFEQRIGDVGAKKMSAVTESVGIRLDYFLKNPLYVGKAVANLIAFDNVKQDQDLSLVQHYLKITVSDSYKQIPQIDMIGYGTDSGDYVAYRKSDNNESQLILKDKRTDGKMTFFEGRSTQSDASMIISRYDPRERPWYSRAMQTNTATWSDVYTSVFEYHPTLTAAIPVIDDSSNINGVLGVDIRIGTLTQFLLDLKNKFDVMIYILDDKGNIISHTGLENTSNSDYHSNKIRFDTLVDPVITQNVRYLSESGLEQIHDTITYQTEFSGKTFLNSVAPYTLSSDDGVMAYVGITILKDTLYAETIHNRVTSWVVGLIICIVGLFIVANHINKIIFPIELAIAAANKLANGHKIKSITTKNSPVKEIQMLVSSFNRMSVTVDSTIKKLESKAFYDEVTGFLNKAGMVDSYNRHDNKSGTLFIFGVDEFNSIYDSLGYDKGDLVKKELANRFYKVIENDVLMATLAGGKFAVYLPKELDFTQAKAYAKSIKQFLTERLVIDGVDIAFRMSVGVVTETQQYSGMEQCLRSANIALSVGKQGSGRIFHFNSAMLEDIELKTKMCAEIKQGIEKQEFVPFYQPLVDLKTGKVIGAEALARWISPKLGIVPPNKFIPIAEEYGFIDQLGQSILLQACTDVTKGIHEGKWSSDFKMHVNISVLQLSRSSFLTSLQEIINSTNVNPKNLSLEITESGLVENTGIFKRNLDAIIAMGIHVSIDDFGTGYSSLSYLQELDFDCLKIDRAFISTLTEENCDSSLTAMILNISKTIDSYVVAEGIETETQAKLLNKLNCHIGQGYYFGRPAPYEDWASNDSV